MRVMRTWACGALVCVTGVLFAGPASSEKEKENRPPSLPATRFPRETPTVLAVRKTREGIVTLKVQKKTARKETIGTGIIVDERGYIVTNRHVIQNATQINVVHHDKSTHTAELDFDEASHDLAVVKIKTSKQLKVLRLGPASDLMVGEEVIAIGNPFGYENSVSEGIISAVGREIEMPGGVTLTDLIQTTASINPGNSGGPLLNINGELIGINVALRQDAQGIAFATNANTVQQVLNTHLSARKVAGICHGLSCRERVGTEAESRQRLIVTARADPSLPRAASREPGTWG